MPLDAMTAFLHRKTLRRLRRRLKKGETVQAVTPGTHEGKPGELVLTSRAMYWIPKRGRIQVRPRTRVHDVRRGNQSGIVDSQRPSWQVQGAPAGAARQFANQSTPPPRDDGDARIKRLQRLLDIGRITQAEYDWMRKE